MTKIAVAYCTGSSLSHFTKQVISIILAISLKLHVLALQYQSHLKIQSHGLAVKFRNKDIEMNVHKQLRIPRLYLLNQLLLHVFCALNHLFSSSALTCDNHQ